MLYPPMANLVHKVGSRYLLVNLVARRARQISNSAEDNGDILDRKPVSSAIEEVYTGKLAIYDAEAEEEEQAQEEQQAQEEEQQETEE